MATSGGNNTCNGTENYYISKRLINSVQGYQTTKRVFKYGEANSPLNITTGSGGKIKFTYQGNKYNPSGGNGVAAQSIYLEQIIDSPSWLGKKVVQINLKFTPTTIPSCNGQEKTINFGGITSPNDGNSYKVTLYQHTHEGGFGNNYPPPVPGPVTTATAETLDR